LAKLAMELEKKAYSRPFSNDGQRLANFFQKFSSPKKENTLELKKPP